MTEIPFISIIIPNKIEVKFIIKCFDSVNKLNYQKDKYETIISDGISTENSISVNESLGAKVINILNKSFSQISRVVSQNKPVVPLFLRK